MFSVNFHWLCFSVRVVFWLENFERNLWGFLPKWQISACLSIVSCWTKHSGEWSVPLKSDSALSDSVLQRMDSVLYPPTFQSRIFIDFFYSWALNWFSYLVDHCFLVFSQHFAHLKEGTFHCKQFSTYSRPSLYFMGYESSFICFLNWVLRVNFDVWCQTHPQKAPKCFLLVTARLF